MSDMENMPDFDSMSPEEIQRWMESLAKRQDADVLGLITDADMDIAEIDPNSVVIDEPGYVPSETFTSSATKARNDAQRATSTPVTPPKAAEPASVTPVSVTPAPVAPTPPRVEPAPPAVQPAAQVQPPVTPARQATRVPTPQTTTPPTQVTPAAAAAPSIPPATTTPARGTGERVRLPTQPPASRSAAATSATPEIPPPPTRVEPVRPAASVTTPASTPAISGGALAWLESLAADQGDTPFELDFSAMGDEPISSTASAAIRESAQPESWLADLVNAGGEPDQIQETPTRAPTAGIFDNMFQDSPSTFLDSLTRRADDDEDNTFSLPDLAPVDADDPADWLRTLSASEGYDEDGVSALALDRFDDDDEAETLDSDAFTPNLSGIELDDDTMDEIRRAISEGRVSPDQMQMLFSSQLDSMAQQPEVEMDDFFDPDAPAIPADLPDWLLSSVGQPPSQDDDTLFDTGRRPLADLFSTDEPTPTTASALLTDNDAVTAGMPDWLRESADEQALDFDSIFDTDAEDAQTARPQFTGSATPAPESLVPSFTLEIDPTDSWAEALDLEQDQGLADLNTVPEWYERNLRDPERIAAVERLERSIANTEQDALLDASLPMDEAVTPGQRMGMPDWLSDIAAADAAPVDDRLATSDMPEWLREAEADMTAPDQAAEAEPFMEDIPDWLVEVVGGYDAEPGVQAQSAAPVSPTAPTEPVVPSIPRVITPPVPPPAPQPRPVTVTISGDAAAALQQARDLTRIEGARIEDLPAGLSLYEALIRASAGLDDVVNDLQSLVRQHRQNPAVYRVLGDGLMRQGKLQQALDTYRDALNQL